MANSGALRRVRRQERGVFDYAWDTPPDYVYRLCEKCGQKNPLRLTMDMPNGYFSYSVLRARPAKKPTCRQPVCRRSSTGRAADL